MVPSPRGPPEGGEIERGVPMRRNVIIVLAIGLLGSVTPATAEASGARAARHRTLPVGTPYAAEVKAQITGAVTIVRTKDGVTNGVCGASPSNSHYQGSFSLPWFAKYPQVTVPVADQRELGAAAKRLHVDAQPTSKGTGGVLDATYSINGYGPPTVGSGESSDCAQKPYSQDGSFKAVGPAEFGRDDVHTPFGVRHVFSFGMPEVQEIPAQYVDNMGTTIDVGQDFTDAVAAVPQPTNLLLAEPGWDSVFADFSIDELKKLVHNSRVNVTVPVSAGTADCGSNTSDAGSYSCTVKWSYVWHVTLIKRFLYRTKHAYAR
jgi:hypothetical protein